MKDLECCSEILRHRGYEVTACTSHVKAARLLERGGFDFIVTSQGTWALEGLCVLPLAKEFNRNTPVLVLATAGNFCRMDCYLQAMQLGAVTILRTRFPLRNCCGLWEAIFGRQPEPLSGDEAVRMFALRRRPGSASPRR